MTSRPGLRDMVLRNRPSLQIKNETLLVTLVWLPEDMLRWCLVNINLTYARNAWREKVSQWSSYSDGWSFELVQL